MKAKKDFLWYKAGDELSPSENQENVGKWIKSGLVEGDATPIAKPNEADLNDDGKVDNKDASIAARTLKKFSRKG